MIDDQGEVVLHLKPTHPLAMKLQKLSGPEVVVIIAGFKFRAALSDFDTRVGFAPRGIRFRARLLFKPENDQIR